MCYNATLLILGQFYSSAGGGKKDCPRKDYTDIHGTNFKYLGKFFFFKYLSQSTNELPGPQS